MRRRSPREPVAVGELRFEHVTAGLRHVRWQQAEVFCGVYVVIRDPRWGTIDGELLDIREVPADAGFRAEWRVRHRDGEIDFRWRGVLEASAPAGGQAELRFTMNGVAAADFEANRIGMCLLHPMWLAGQPAAARTTGGWAEGRFPDDIAPHQPFMNFTGLRHSLGDSRTVEITLTGEVFEMEDQRNWTDPSFKTYCPPLATPYPRVFRAGETITQSVTVRISGPPAAAGGTRTAGSAGRGAASRRRPESVSVRLESGLSGRLPAIGIGLAGSDAVLSRADYQRLDALRPAHLHGVIDLTSQRWRAELRRVSEAAAALNCPADLEVVTDGAAALNDVAAALSDAGRRANGIGRVFLYDKATSQTPGSLADRWLATGRGAPAGGSRADFAQLNRADLALGRLSALAFAVSPQVHASDDESIMETLAAQPVAASRAIRLAQGRPVVVGPITLKPRFNPALTTAAESAPSQANQQENIDTRQATALAAAWTMGSIAALAPTGVSALTYFETSGAKGLLAGAARLPEGFPEPGAIYPVYHVLARVAPLSGQPLAVISSSDPMRVAALAVATTGLPLIFLANLTPEPVSATLDAPHSQFGWALRRLPATPAAAQWPDSEADPPEQLGSAGPVLIGLDPWQVITIGGNQHAAVPREPR